MKKILFLYCIILSTLTFAGTPDYELRIYDDAVMIQRYMGSAVLQEDGSYKFISRAEPLPPIPEYKNYALWRLIPLQQNLSDRTIYHLGDQVPFDSHCIVPFVNGIMSPKFSYDSVANTITFLDDLGVAETLPTDYNVTVLILKINPDE